jgi:hypothetical protein
MHGQPVLTFAACVTVAHVVAAGREQSVQRQRMEAKPADRRNPGAVSAGSARRCPEMAKNWIVWIAFTVFLGLE